MADAETPRLALGSWGRGGPGPRAPLWLSHPCPAQGLAPSRCPRESSPWDGDDLQEWDLGHPEGRDPRPVPTPDMLLVREEVMGQNLLPLPPVA